MRPTSWSAASDRALIIDDDSERVAFAREVLERAGYEVRVAAGAAEVAPLARRWRPAVVVTSAPHAPDGLADVPTVTIADDRTVRAVDPAGPSPVVAPFDRADLLAAVWVALNP